jgi:hypothetical protein
MRATYRRRGQGRNTGVFSTPEFRCLPDVTYYFVQLFTVHYLQNFYAARIPQLNGEVMSEEQTLRSEDNAFCL